MLTKPKNITKQSGVYLFKNKENQIVYIGKAKNIADRIVSYFNNPDDFKNNIILQEATSLETIPTNSETEALYLEADLIKKYQPKFNQLLKDGNPFIYLFFSNEKLPSLSVVRTKAKSKKGTYIGPFLTKKIAHSVFNFLTTTFQLNLCKKKIAHGCLKYHIGICAGFCSPDFDLDFYKFRLTLAQHVVSKKPELAIKIIDKEIKTASKQMQFERAKKLVEYQKNLEQFTYMLHKLSDMPTRQHTPTMDKNMSLLLAIQQRLHLKHIPYVIDCFDISHMQGMAIVGSCIRYVHGQPEPKSFRHFMIKSLDEQDDYAALREIVQRRYKTGTNFPNLIIVDGGKGQINAIKPYVGSAELVGLAKKEETIISADFQQFIQLNHQHPQDALLLQIRDKTHQFAISYHRKKRSITKSD